METIQDGSMARPAKSTFTPEYDALRKELIRLRRNAGLTQRELARRLGRVHSYIGRAEIGGRRLDLVEFVWVCRACGQDPIEVMSRWLSTMRASERRGRGRPPTVK